MESVGRLNTNGTVDTSFYTAGQDLGDANRVLIEQDDGSVLIGGDVTAKLDPQGRLASDFTPRRSNVPEVYTMALDGTNIIVGGQFPGFYVLRTNLARLMQNGRVDLTYNPAAGANKVVYSIALQDDGRLIVSGSFTIFAGQPRAYLVRLTGDQPTLSITKPARGEFTINWPARFSNWVLCASSDLTTTNWPRVTNQPALIGNQRLVTNSISDSARFFRLFSPP